jgi:hypothetical protein
MTEYRRRRFVSVNRVRSQDRRTVIDAICEEGRAWWLVIGDSGVPEGWSELRPLPEIEVGVTEPARPTPAPTSTSEAAPVATDEELRALYELPGTFADSRRAVYILGRQHGAAQPPAAQPASPVAGN